MTQQSPSRLLKEKAEAVSSIVSDVSSLKEAFKYAVAVTRKQGGKTIAAPGLSAQDQSTFKALCEEQGLTLLTEGLREHTRTMHTGFSVADWGIAETGTMVMDSSREDIRLASMLTETHVVVIPKARIRLDAMALEPELTKYMKSSPSYLAFISGASRTADIERVLTIGVHGPQEFHILILEETQS